MALSSGDCKTLKTQMAEIEARLHEFALGEHAGEIQTGGDRTRFNNTSESALKRQLARLESKYNAGGCAVTLGSLETMSSRAPIRPFF